MGATRAAAPLAALLAATALGLSCGEKPAPLYGDGGPDGDTDADSDSDGDTDTFPCDALPSAPVEVEELTGPVAFHDLAFDGAGSLVGTDSGLSALFRTPAGGTAALWASGVYGAQGMAFLPDGDLVAITDGQGIVRVTPEGAVTTIAPSILGYGVQVTIGPDEMIYVGDNTTLHRVDPDTGAAEALVEGVQARGCDFSPDLSRMYIPSYNGNGDVFVAELDADLNVVGAPTLFATIPGGGPWLDGLRVDECGNLYVPSYTLSQLWRISPEGVPVLYYSWSSNPAQYGHGLKWGDGLGWDHTSIYMPQPYDGATVTRLEVGVRYRE